ncbi:fluoride efflux transporter FluC [Bifidobacterium olomucense]|uniref:Fluoride-specific ion channel FluC n=1 Tax=Bifidobacterium olomucense TaxID=2675324 RepID=A0A7Y0EY90_9BIFI|nr:CrcB family protein [Bifidobacterium sp. DSM 109959]NMM98616.1 family protein CrcB [Bifidobacterium sp. DSM 109959]
MSDSVNNTSAEPQPSTQEISVAQVRAQSMPEPQGAAAAAKPPQIPLAPIKRVQARFNPLADGMLYLVVFLGGTLGTAMRYGLSFILPATAGAEGFWHAFHVPTFTANMAACFIFACLTSYLSQAVWIRKRVRELTSRGIGMGMCGGFSTLSALAIEELTTLQGSVVAGAVCYMLVSFLLGLIVAYVGARLGLALAADKTAKVAIAAVRQQQTGNWRHVTAGETVVVPTAQGNGSVASPASSPVSPSDMPGVPNAASITSDGTDSAPAATAPINPPSYEPAPITDEIPLVGDPTTGEAH